MIRLRDEGRRRRRREGERGAGEQAANVKIVCGEIRKQARKTESKEI